MGMGYKSGRMGPSTKVFGRTAKLQAKADLFMSTEMSMRASGRMTRLRAMESTCITTEQGTKVDGCRTINTDMGARAGLMEVPT